MLHTVQKQVLEAGLGSLWCKFTTSRSVVEITANGKSVAAEIMCCKACRLQEN